MYPRNPSESQKLVREVGGGENLLQREEDGEKIPSKIEAVSNV